MKFSFAFSPCPNDTFMFEPIVNKRIDLMGFDFDIIMEDVEYLNKAAFQNKFDISKLSFNAFAQLTQQYQLLNSGSALGRNCGPLLISKEKYKISDVPDLKICTPGINTTASMLLEFAFPNLKDVAETLFSDIESAVLNEQYDAGLIIHENRFTYLEKGLHKILDLGEFWEQNTRFPIPLGGIAIDKSMDEGIKMKIDKIVRNSIEFAFDQPNSGIDFIRFHAQEMDEKVMYEHIRLYVNEFSKKINSEGKEAIHHLVEYVQKTKSIQADNKALFVSDEQ